jgi:type IV pilus assembly protein PilB
MDPDIILVGEIRDEETAGIAVEAALTGHLLVSTLHTNDAPSTVTRLVEMGIEPFNISASLVCVCAQRLLRRVCKTCKTPYQAEGREKRCSRRRSDGAARFTRRTRKAARLVPAPATRAASAFTN